MFDGDALGPRGLLGSFGRQDLLVRRTQLVVQGVVGGPVIVHGPLGLVEVLHGPFEEVATAHHLLSRPDGVRGEPRGGLVELPGEIGGPGVRDPRLHPLLRPLVQQRTLGLQVTRDEPLFLVELVQAGGETGELFLRAAGALPRCAASWSAGF